MPGRPVGPGNHAKKPRKFVLSGIGTGRPARRRPAALDRPGHSRGAVAAGGGEMTMVSSKAAKDNALFGRIRQSSHCQQEEQLRAAAAVGGYHEIGETVTRRSS